MSTVKRIACPHQCQLSTSGLLKSDRKKYNFSKECQKRCSETNFDLQTAGTATVLGAGYFGMSVELSSQSTRISENTNYIDDTCTRVSVVKGMFSFSQRKLHGILISRIKTIQRYYAYRDFNLTFGQLWKSK